MEARSFFENSPMHEITVTATPEEWAEVMTNLVDGDWTDGGTELFRSLRRAGVEDF